MIRLPALLVACGVGVGAVLALPTLAVLLAPWLGLGLVLLSAAGGVAVVVGALGRVRNEAWRDSYAASNERIRLTLEAGRAQRLGSQGRDVDVWTYRTER